MENKTMGLLIIGAGGHGRVVKETALSMNNMEYQEISFLDDNNSIAVGKLGEYEKYAKDFQYAFVAIGNPAVRKEWICKLEKANFNIPTLIHPSAYVAPSASIDKGSVILPGAIVQANVVIGEGAIISSGAIIDHDAVIGNYCHINAGAVVSSGAKVSDTTKLNYLKMI